MRIVTTVSALRELLHDHRGAGRSVGFVPTMGFLHEGHLSLMQAADADNEVVVTSIFVNPLQFAPHEDLEAYPRDLDADAAACESVGVDIVFAPDVTEMYPDEIWTTVHVGVVSEALEGEARPTHFDGVATVVTKLFAIMGPCRAYFGEKDFQQLAIVSRLAADLSLPVEVIGCPTVREVDGLAMSSRNVYLTDHERAQAAAVNQALHLGLELIESGTRDRQLVEEAMRRHIEAQPSARVEYVVAVDAESLRPVDPLTGSIRVLAAVRFGAARLIDNMGIVVDD
ncbi:MAG: pantoate--beta-alanine ligase [Acidimicrobiia bacterium]|nr:pantoate--beta-alanine ligase [Acidimicrobiia bacterium]